MNEDMVRDGICLYGLYPSEEVNKERLPLEPAMQWKTYVSYVKELEAGVEIGYGGTIDDHETNDGCNDSGWICRWLCPLFVR